MAVCKDAFELTPAHLTGDQKRIMLILCNASETDRSVRLVCTQGPNPIRETSTGTALIRKGLASKRTDGTFQATLAGFWMGDRLRILNRLGKIPARRSARAA